MSVFLFFLEIMAIFAQIFCTWYGCESIIYLELFLRNDRFKKLNLYNKILC